MSFCSPRFIFLVFCIVVLSACGGDSGSTTAVQSPPSQSPLSSNLTTSSTTTSISSLSATNTTPSNSASISTTGTTLSTPTSLTSNSSLTTTSSTNSDVSTNTSLTSTSASAPLNSSPSTETITVIDTGKNTTTTTSTEAPSVITTQETEQITSIAKLFPEDLAEDYARSTPIQVEFPKGLDHLLSIKFDGAFRVDGSGESVSDYAIGTLGFNPDNNSLYMAGHSHHNAIAEFAIPTSLTNAVDVNDLGIAVTLQDYVQVLNKQTQGQTTNKITGLLYHQGALIVNSEIWYDASGTNQDNQQVFFNPNDLANSSFTGMLQVENAAKAAGYMSKVPSEWQDAIGNDFLIGWASNYSIIGRYSVGPSFHGFNPDDSLAAQPDFDPAISVNTHMMFSLSQQIVDDANKHQDVISPIWGPMAKVMYGFIVPDTDYFLAIGSQGGLNFGSGYKITQDTGNLCGGGCTKVASDIYNYFWIFDMKDIVNAEAPHLIQPVSYGKWSHPYDDNGSHRVIGATFDDYNHQLYVALGEAGQIGAYDRKPLILRYTLKAK